MIRTVCIVDAETLQRNHDNAASLGLPWLAAHPSRSSPLAVVGGGQSALDCLDEIRGWPGPVMAINGAYDWLMQNGIVADYGLCLDPKPVMAKYLQHSDAATHWLVATACAPEVFDRLKGQRITLWKARQGDEEPEPGDIPGGSTATARAPVVGAVLGYRRIVLFGADSCFHGERTHVYEHKPKYAVIERGGWKTTRQLLAQAQYLAEMIPAMRPIRVEIRGRNLASDLLNEKTQEAA